MKALTKQIINNVCKEVLAEEIYNAVMEEVNQDTSETYKPVIKVADKHSGLSISDGKVSLVESWGTKLSNKLHSFIDKPVNIVYKDGYFLIANGNDSEESATACAVFDEQLNFLGTVGKKGSVLNSGEYSVASDFNYSKAESEFCIACPQDNVVHFYHESTKQFKSKIGTGVAGTSATTLTEPIAIKYGLSRFYILCKSGVPSGATGPGYVSVYSRKTKSFLSIPIFNGKNGGSGKCFEGEISSPKDFFITSDGNTDTIYILNGTNEVGVFKVEAPSDVITFKLEKVINIPPQITSTNLGLSHIFVHVNGNNKTIYLTASDSGQVIAIDYKTGNLIGSFGRLADESGKENDDTLGHFNGLKGISIVNNKIYSCESLNNRIQVFGTSLFTEQFHITFENITIAQNQQLKDISGSLLGTPLSSVKVIDFATKTEYDLRTAILNQFKNFHVKVLIEPYSFSRKTPTFVINPVFVILKSYTE